MSDETKAPVPPGWVRLRLPDASGSMIAPAAVVRNTWMAGAPGSARDDAQAYVLGTWVAETWAEVAALIAEAESKERRARTLPVMAAELYGKGGMGGMGTEDAVTYAAAILDAIERREAE